MYHANITAGTPP